MSGQLALSVVIPTRNEAENIPELVLRLNQRLDVPAELVFVDDSSDHTPEVIAAAATWSQLPVRLLHRPRPDGGLGGAVVLGLREAQAPWAVVMDADLQHPPEFVPTLYAETQVNQVDMVVASRYRDGGGRDGLANAYRMLASSMSCLLVRCAFPGLLRHVTDPLSGFFAVRREALDLAMLRPHGYKILLELIARSRSLRVTEVGFLFAPRHAGESKFSVHEVLRFLWHLVNLRLSDTPAQMLAFGLIGISGLAPNLLVLALLSSIGVHYLPAAIAANQIGIVWNFLLLDQFLWRQWRRGHWLTRLCRYMLVSNVDLLLRIPMLAALVSVVGLGPLTATVVTLVLMFALRFIVTRRVVYWLYATRRGARLRRLAVR
jgi:dolichol-phosphate mannosyltransferase